MARRLKYPESNIAVQARAIITLLYENDVEYYINKVYELFEQEYALNNGAIKTKGFSFSCLDKDFRDNTFQLFSLQSINRRYEIVNFTRPPHMKFIPEATQFLMQFNGFYLGEFLKVSQFIQSSLSAGHVQSSLEALLTPSIYDWVKTKIRLEYVVGGRILSTLQIVNHKEIHKTAILLTKAKIAEHLIMDS